ncbi:MAG: GNAT family N-acetyltransferase [Flavobacteriales bacterium]
MIKFLEGQRVFLRALSSGDVGDRYLSWLNDEETTRGLASGIFPTTLAELNEFVQRSTANRNIVMLAICDQSNGLHIGNIKLDQFDWVSRTCELGILIGDKNYWGKGIGHEVCSLVLNYAFEDLNIRKVSLAVYANNPAAIKLYHKLGFQEEGRLRKHIFEGGTYHDKYFMGLFKEELR